MSLVNSKKGGKKIRRENRKKLELARLESTRSTKTKKKATGWDLAKEKMRAILPRRDKALKHSIKDTLKNNKPPYIPTCICTKEVPTLLHADERQRTCSMQRTKAGSQAYIQRIHACTCIVSLYSAAIRITKYQYCCSIII